MNDHPTALPKDEVMFVQRPRVHVRSTPGRSGRILATVARGAEVKVVGHSGNWVQVESQAGNGWIANGLLGPSAPARR
jgi:uncharacterized protein YgiM (DUF1202 family)